MRNLLLLCVLLAGCQARDRAGDGKVGLEETRAKVLDVVLGDWMAQGPDMRSVSDTDQAVVLLRRNLPRGYQPQVVGRRILVADQFIGKLSSQAQTLRFKRGEESVVLYEGQRSLDGDADNIGPHCLQFDRVEIDRDRCSIDISQNRRLNLGASGGTYVLRRDATGWRARLMSLWQS